MPPDFNWKDETDHSWNEYDSPRTVLKAINRRSGRLPVLVLLVVVIAAGAYIIFRFVDGFVADASSTIEQDIQSTHELISEAVMAHDSEIVSTMISGRDQEWTAAQLTLVKNGTLYDRPMLGFARQDKESPRLVDITLSSDLLEAEVVSEIEYDFAITSNENDRVTLLHTTIYRRSEDRWLLSPPSETFWGNVITAEGRYVIVTFPERDREIGRSLAADLEAIVGRACDQLPEFSCEDGSQLIIDFSIDPAVLLRLALDEPFSGPGRTILLPTPALVGIPKDDQSYSALLKAYARRVLGSVSAEIAQYRCCTGQIFFEALLDQQLDRLRLVSYPLTLQDYRIAIGTDGKVRLLSEAWGAGNDPEAEEKDPPRALVYTFVAFLLEQVRTFSPLQLQSSLVQADDFESWLALYLGPNSSTSSLERTYSNYLSEFLSANQRTPAVALPEQDLLLMCGEGIVGAASLYEYDLGEGIWSHLSTNRNIIGMSSLPGNNGVILIDQIIRPVKIQSILLRDGQEYLLSDGTIAFRATGRTVVLEDHVVLQGFELQGTSGGQNVYFELDLSSCNNNSCAKEALEGDVLYSPEGRYMLIWRDDGQGDVLLQYSDGRLINNMGEGSTPYFLGEEHFAYLVPGDRPEVAIAASTGGEQIAVLRSETLAAAANLPTDFYFDITNLIAPMIPGAELFITAKSEPAGKHFLFGYDVSSGELRLRLELEATSLELRPISFSPDNRWLGLAQYGRSDAGVRIAEKLYLYDYQNHTSYALPTLQPLTTPLYDWSSDGKWLLQLTDRVVTLTSPDQRYQYYVPHDLESCRGAVWLNNG